MLWAMKVRQKAVQSGDAFSQGTRHLCWVIHLTVTERRNTVRHLVWLQKALQTSIRIFCIWQWLWYTHGKNKALLDIITP